MKHKILFATLVLVSLAAGAQDQTITKAFKDVKSISITTGSGDILLQKSSGPDVKVTLKHTYDQGEFEPIFEMNGGNLTLEERIEPGNHSGSSRWVLEIPDRLKVKATTGWGNVSVEGIQVDITSNMGSGDVKLANVKGELDLNTGLGNITVQQIDGDAKMTTGSGNISAKNSSGLFAFNTGFGDIRIDDTSGDFRANTGSGNISVRNLKVSGSSSFNSGSGDVTVGLSGDLNFNLSMSSGSGDSRLDFNGAPISGNIVMTANKRRGDIVAPFKFDKEETIQQGLENNVIQKTAKIGTKDIRIQVATGSGTAQISK